MEPQDDNLLGRVIEGYQVISRIGEGAMGRVYLAKHPMIGKKIAIKVLKPDLVRTHVQMTRFLREAQTVNEIGHQNVVDIFNFVYHQETKEAYILMEYLDGYTLADAVEQEGPQPLKRIIQIGQQICSALQAAHERGIIHRDLKPENVFLTERNGQKDFVKLIDFGLAKLRESGDARPITFHGALLGTPAYMSPEQALGEPIDARTDLYALGLVLYEAITGVLPFASRSLQETLAGRLLFQAPPLRSYRSDLPEQFEATILRCLQKDREKRPASAEELSEELLGVIQNGPPSARSSSFSSFPSEEEAAPNPDNPWDEPEATLHQDVSKEGPKPLNPPQNGRPLSYDPSHWNEKTLPSKRSQSSQEVITGPYNGVKNWNESSPQTIDERPSELQSSQELNSHEFVLEEDVDVPTEDSWDKKK